MTKHVFYEKDTGVVITVFKGRFDNFDSWVDDGYVISFGRLIMEGVKPEKISYLKVDDEVSVSPFEYKVVNDKIVKNDDFF